MEFVTLKKDEVLFRQGDVADGFMYEIMAGSVNVYGEQDGHEQLLTTLNVGESFGELALLGEGVRTATVVAAEKTMLYPVDKAGMRVYFRERPAKFYSMMQRVSGRIRDLSKDYVKASAVLEEYTAAKEAGKPVDDELNAAMKAVINAGKKKGRK